MYASASCKVGVSGLPGSGSPVYKLMSVHRQTWGEVPSTTKIIPSFLGWVWLLTFFIMLSLMLCLKGYNFKKCRYFSLLDLGCRGSTFEQWSGHASSMYEKAEKHPVNIRKMIMTYLYIFEYNSGIGNRYRLKGKFTITTIAMQPCVMARKTYLT